MTKTKKGNTESKKPAAEKTPKVETKQPVGIKKSASNYDLRPKNRKDNAKSPTSSQGSNEQSHSKDKKKKKAAKFV